MSHERMIAWLEKASSEAVQAAADRLSSAATEIDKIGEELKIRPQIVDWEGEGANSFRTWSADLANATLRLGLYSREASKRLGEAAEAIALAKAAAPHPQPGAEATLKAALSVPNDPDASALARKLHTEKDAMAREMTKLSQAYNQSVDGIGALKKPEFPPPPQVIAPHDDQSHIGEQGGHIGPGAGYGSAASGTGYAAAPGHSTDAAPGVTRPVGGMDVSPHTVSPSVSRPVDMSIDGLAVLPDAPSSPVANPVAPPPTGPRPDTVFPPTVGTIPPAPSTGPFVPRTSGGGRATGMPRLPVSPQGVSPFGPGPLGRSAGPNGTSGGRVVPPGAGRPAVGIPRGTVIGSENAHGQTPMGRAPGMGGGVGPGVSANAAGGGRRLAGEIGGVVGGHQQQGRAGTRPFTPGGSGLVRGGASGDSERGAGLAGRGGGMAPQGSRMPATGRDEGGERPNYLVEDDETWQQGGRRVVPPVID
ncbi:WXG100 family type VII secretion target [Streptomyces atratus]